ncbi:MULTISPECIES: AI-2E family transporter [unclassified Methylobacterium]|uniref:AI-2E family transporter n=3 Tax=Methylobacterium TaxID=407 RepID=UPI0011C20318|nr:MULTISPECIES: AI-2E family transporter [unclassified Methylobacterium]MCJ2118446.1 AI-2E family transporter [Methylobacterium sp. J-001]QEE41617.1 AI-2E family transporter [Methylobacterium sp. WL1]TXN57253.1 AI-2E family transporter [Methylobacterium sp. WL2]
MPMDDAVAAKPPAQVPPSLVPGLRGLLTLAVGVVLIAALYFGREVFIPLVLAVLLSFVLAPVVNLLRRIKLGRVPSVIVAVLLALGVIGGIGAVIGTQVAGLAGNLPQYQATVSKKFAGLQQGWLGEANRVIAKFSHQVHDATQKADAAGTTAATGPGGDTPKAQLVRVQEPEISPLALAEKVLGPIFEPLTTVGIVLVVVVFLLLQREDLRNRMIRLFGSSDLHRTTVAMDDAAGRLGTYFLAQLGMNAAFGVIVGVGLWFIGVPNPLLWGVFSALMRFVPYIGAFISGILPVALAAAVDPGWNMVIATAALFLIAEPVFGQVIEPLLYGHSTGLSPFAVIVSTLFWGFLWGPIGLILATPFTVCLVVLGRHVDSLEFLDILLGDRPPLTPVENFYQRMLAGDPDEARDLGEQMLKERSLSSYYDEVALKGLQLAANDYARGVVTPAQLENIRASSRSLVEDFEDHPDVEPAGTDATVNPNDTPTLAERAHPKNEAVPGQAPPREALPEAWRGEAPVLCLAGRGPLDEASSAMLAQLLRKHGLGARVTAYQSASREGIRDLDLSGVAMVCISYLDITGNPSHLRYLLERLRRKSRDVKLLVGLWPQGEAVLTDTDLGRQVGADAYVSSLRGAVEACLREAGATNTGDETPAAANAA